MRSCNNMDSRPGARQNPNRSLRPGQRPERPLLPHLLRGQFASMSCHQLGGLQPPFETLSPFCISSCHFLRSSEPSSCQCAEFVQSTKRCLIVLHPDSCHPLLASRQAFSVRPGPARIANWPSHKPHCSPLGRQLSLSNICVDGYTPAVFITLCFLQFFPPGPAEVAG